MSLIEDLHAKRLNAVEALRTHIEDIEKRDDNDWNAEADQDYKRINAEIDGLDVRIADLRKAEERQKDADETRELYERAAKTPAEERQDAKPSDDDILRKMVEGEIRGYEFRDLSVGTSTAGGNTVPTSFLAQLQEHMIEVSAIRQAGATVITTDAGEALEIPKTTAHSSAAIISEGGSITESDPTFGKVTLNAYKYGLSIDISTELEQDSAFDLSGYLARQAGRAIGNASGAHFVTGDGSSKPNGVATASTLGVTGATSVSGAFTADNLIDLYFSVIAPYRANATWLMADGAIASARKLKDGNDQYLWVPGLQAGVTDTLLGKPVISDTNVADQATSAKSVLFGDFSTYFIRDVRGFRAERSVDFKFSTDQATWRFLFRTDGDLVDTTGAVKHFVGGAS